MTYNHGNGGNRGGYGNRGGGGNRGNYGGGGNQGFTPKDGDVYLNEEMNPKGPNSPSHWGTGTFKGEPIRLAMWPGKKHGTFKVSISEKQQQGGGNGGYGNHNQPRGGYGNRQPQQQQGGGYGNNGGNFDPSLNDDVPF